MIDRYTANRFVILTPFKQAVTYYARQFVDGIAQDSYTSYSLAQARARDVTKKDVATDPELLSSVDIVFELWQPVMSAVGMPRPRKDDYITDCSGNSYTVAMVTGEFNRSVWTLVCRKTNEEVYQGQPTPSVPENCGSSSIRNITEDTTVTASDRIIVADATSNPITVTLPSSASVTPGRRITVKKVDASENVVSVVSNNIDGETTIEINLQWGSYDFASNGFYWIIV